jgi:hypothetical protein
MALLLALIPCGLVWAQNDADPKSTTNSEAAEPAPPKDAPADKSSTVKQLKEAEERLSAQAQKEVSEIAKTIDKDPRAKTVSAGILQPIYQVAEALAFPAFHWVAFSLMAAGVFSFALQLVLGKLVVLTKMGFSLKEIISDAVGLAISIVGLVLTTQAAAENSSFTQSPAAVISATVVGALAGIILYRWGQAQELEAVAGRTRQNAPATAKK